MLYQMPDSFAVGDFTKKSPVAHHRAGLSAYTAVLYEPGALQPFTTRTAGRELLGCTESQLLARNSSVQNNAHMPDSAALSSILSKAISSPKAEVKTPDTRRKPFILIQARGSSPPETYTARIHALAGYLNCACLSFLGVWHGPILSGLFSILFCRLGISCLSLALRKPEKDPAFTLIDVSPLPEIPGGESGFNPG